MSKKVPNLHLAIFLIFEISFIPLVTCFDSRCYLKDGGSSETFTVNERLDIGGTIGKLNVIGGFGRDGNVSLYLSHEDTISFVEGTNELILMKKLDKEGSEGPSSVYVTAYCNRTGTDDVPVPIPIRIVVIDFNDNSPVFEKAPYTVNVSEVTVVGSLIFSKIRASDDDQRGPSSTVEYFIEPGPYSDYVRIESSFDGTVNLNSSLDYETLPMFTVAIKAQDQGKPPRSSFTNLTIRVVDADDQNPRFEFDKYTATLPENASPGTLIHVSPASVRAYDPDFGINASVTYSLTSDVPEYEYFDLDGRTGHIFLRQSIPDDLVTPLTLVVIATQEDNKDRYSSTTVTLHEPGGFNTNYLQFLQPEYVVMTPEGVTLVDHPIQTVQTNKQAGKGVAFQVIEQQDTFRINEKGEIILMRPLDYENQRSYLFHILAVYKGMNATTKVNVTVMDSNDHDPNFNQTMYTFYLNEDDPIPGAFVGKVEVSDGDGDKIRLSLSGPLSKAFYINDDGILRIKKVAAINSSESQIIVVATDTGIPSRQSSVPVTVVMPSKMALATKSNTAHSLILLIVFGSVLGVLLVVIVTLSIYIVKNKRYRRRLSAMMTSPNHTPKAKAPSYGNGTTVVTSNMLSENRNDSNFPETQNGIGVENPIFNLPENNNVEISPRDNRFTPRLKPIKVQPVQPPRVPDVTQNCHPNNHHHHHQPIRNGSVSSSSNNQRNNIPTPTPPPPPPKAFLTDNSSTRSPPNVRWSNGSIPRRVKKLSWEDEQDGKMIELDPDVSVAPLNKSYSSPSSNDQSSRNNDLTIYF